MPTRSVRCSRQAATRLLTVSVALAAVAGVIGHTPAPPDAGSSGAWQRILKLRTTASLLHITAHPDDEQGGMLARVSRREGARTELLTLNRGEAGDNALGPQLFDALGLIRTEELALAGRYYGLDDQHYTAVADYGFSKRLDEALEQWDRPALLGDMVRVIRRSRPLVVVSRWQGSERDGHGQHQATGALAPEAVRLAADSAAYPGLVAEGLLPWSVRKLYVGGIREHEPWQVKVEAGEFDAVLGASYHLLGRLGLSMQRSQTSGRFDPFAPGAPLYFRRVDPPADSAVKESGFFDGLETRIADVYRLSGSPAPAGGDATLAAIDREVESAVRAFQHTLPSASAPALARGLSLVRAALDAAPPEVRHLLQIKERQFCDALVAAAGLEVRAIAEPPDAPDGGSTPFAPPAVLGPLSAGQRLRVRAMVTNRGSSRVQLDDVSIGGPPGSTFEPRGDSVAGDIAPNVQRERVFTGTIAREAPATRPYFIRRSIAASRYTLLDSAYIGRPSTPPPVTARVLARIEGTPLDITTPVLRREANLPYGYELRTLEILPALSVRLTPAAAVVPKGQTPATATIEVTVTNHGTEPQSGELGLQAGGGWRGTPRMQPFTVSAGGDARFTFKVTAPAGAGSGAQDVRAVATAAGRTFDSGLQVIRHRDLPLLYLYQPALGTARMIDVTITPGLRVGYVMGVGDEIPTAIGQLGARVDLLGADDLATGSLQVYDTIVTGTRAYAVRADLRAHNRRLLEYVRGGGNLVVLYNTPEFVPREHAPFPAELPNNAEEVAEERAAVELLEPRHPILSRPNRITSGDFDGWIEQRGSKFFSTWDAAYTPLLSSHDRGQSPQRGGLLHARFGRGHYTYMAYALHRQLPYGVPGAYRLLANLLSLGAEPARASSGVSAR